jgi:hypothetical protein
MFRRVVGPALSAAAAVCLLVSPVEAAIEADFNGDGVLDRVVLSHPHETSIVVRMPGSPPQVLKLHDRIIAIIATDINHDGEIDLGALSERRGVFIWLNGGKSNNGRLKALKRKHHRGGFSLSTRGPLASAPGSSPDGSAATGLQDDRSRSASYECSTPELNQRPALDLITPLVERLPDAGAGASQSRAPPSALEETSVRFN